MSIKGAKLQRIHCNISFENQEYKLKKFNQNCLIWKGKCYDQILKLTDEKLKLLLKEGQSYFQIKIKKGRDNQKNSSLQQTDQSQNKENYIQVEFNNKSNKSNLYKTVNLKQSAEAFIGLTFEGNLEFSMINNFTKLLLSFYFYANELSVKKFTTDCIIFKQIVNQQRILPGNILKLADIQFEVQRFNVGCGSHQGNRPSMEDTFLIIQDLQIDPFVHTFSYFAVFDGHLSVHCSQYLRSKYATVLKSELKELIFGESYGGKNFVLNLGQCLKKTFLKIDQMYYEQEEQYAMRNGSTGNVILIVGNKIFCANVGDSRAVLSRNGRAVELSKDHKASSSQEISRIQAVGGKVTISRVFGELAISRAFGDFNFKKVLGNPLSADWRASIIHAEPDIRVVDINPITDEFILIASDGVFDKFSSQQSIDFIRTKLSKQEYMQQDPKSIAQDLCNEAIYERGSSDNCTAIIITLNRGIIL